ncbi:hypothetical protein L204_100786 [Cryptococcus depauperatus]|nr:hypothetical protein L204_01283 [Cryptococcus depauperatus CBS 7855]
MSTAGRQTPTRPSIRETIAARRAELRNTPKSQRSGDLQTFGSPVGKQVGTPRGFVHLDGNGMNLIDDKTVEGQIKKAAKSGKLDLSALELESLPSKVYTSLLGLGAEELSKPPPLPQPVAPKPRPSASPFAIDDDLERIERDEVFGSVQKKEDTWSEPEELTTLKAGSNKIVDVDKEIGMFGGLKILDLSNNLISSLPTSLSDLLRLTILDLSHNSLSAIPRSVLVLPQLQIMNLSHNNITEVSFTDPIGPSEDGLGYGSGFFTTAIQRAAALKTKRSILPSLHQLNLGNNKIAIDGLAGFSSVALREMRVLNLENNMLRGIIDVEKVGIGAKSMPELSQLVLSGNTGLRGTKGELSEGVKLDNAGCDTNQLSPTTNQGVTARIDSNTVKNVASEVIDAEPTASVEPSLPIPEPDMTINYRTLPAATFESEPLPVDFDLYLPTAPAGPTGHPIVIWFHGGGLLQGNKENLPPHFRRLPFHTYPGANGRPDENVAVISSNYRLAPQVPILDILSDVNVLMSFVQTKLNDKLTKEGKGEHKIDPNRICLSGGSAGGYLALLAGLEIPNDVDDEKVGGYRGAVEGIRCLAPFYPITDLTDNFWATETNPVPWMNGKSILHAEAKPHIDTKAAHVCTTPSGGPRSILYPYMLQHALFPSLLFLTQRSVGSGMNAFRPTPLSLSIPNRLELVTKFSKAKPHVPIYFVYGTLDDKVQPMEKTIRALHQVPGELEIERVEGGDHAYDEDPNVQCEAFRKWLGTRLL